MAQVTLAMPAHNTCANWYLVLEPTSAINETRFN
jgi:hypothetical protein